MTKIFNIKAEISLAATKIASTPGRGMRHTTVYCSGWADGYTATWNANHTIVPTPLVVPSPGISQSPGALDQGQGHGNSNACFNVVNCNPSTTQKQDASGSVKNAQ